MTASNKVKLKNLILVLLSITVWLPTNTFAQDRGNLQETIFKNTDKLLALARSEQASILSPANFKKALDKYNQAQRDLKMASN